MKKFIALFIVLTFAAVCFAQTDPVIGFWLSVDEKTNATTAGWRIYTENNRLLGEIVSVPNEPRGALAYTCKASYPNFPREGNVSQMPLAGTPFIFGLVKKSNGVWENGNIIDPNDGKMYGCKINFLPAGSKVGNRTLQVDTLEVRGTIGPFGRSQYWNKTDQQTANSLWPR